MLLLAERAASSLVVAAVEALLANPLRLLFAASKKALVSG